MVKSTLTVATDGDKGSVLRGIDFFVDGQPLKPVLRVAPGSLVCVLGWNPRSDIDAVQTLKLEQRSVLENGRVPLYVCRECGDIGCGATTAQIAIEGDTVRWSDFGSESNMDYDGNGTQVDLFPAWAPRVIEFDLDHRRVLAEHLAAWNGDLYHPRK